MDWLNHTTYGILVSILDTIFKNGADRQNGDQRHHREDTVTTKQLGANMQPRGPLAGSTPGPNLPRCRHRSTAKNWKKKIMKTLTQ